MTRTPEVYEQTDRESIGDTVIRAVSDAKGVDPLALDDCLYDAVDPTALERLCGAGEADRATSAGTRVSFVFEGHRVTADGSGTVTLTEIDGTAPGQGQTSQAVLRDPTSSWRQVFQRL